MTEPESTEVESFEAAVQRDTEALRAALTVLIDERIELALRRAGI